ncbi:60S ribosomal protein L18 [Dictyocoela muelleri]|nr:60S ribosomal protein L18 [Dictyocoela muelleri]
MKTKIFKKDLKTRKFPIFDPKRKSKSRNTYHQSLLNLYKKITENTENQLIHKIVKRLTMTRSNRQPLKISKLIPYADKVIVMVGKILDDEKMFSVPKMKIVAHSISRTAHAKLLKNGGEFYTLDQLFVAAPGLKNVELVQGDRTHRLCYKYFGAAGEKGSLTYPRTSNEGINGERRIMKRIKPVYE